jgi:RNAse (barnase) inhibitor barstar
MDELTFRRHVLANPFSQDAQVIQAAHQDPVKQQFWHDLKQQELALQQALQIDVPHDFADKLLWEQISQTETANFSHPTTPRRPLWFAIAASMLLAISLGWVNFNSKERTFYDDIIAHIEHVSEHEITGDVITLAALNSKLAKFGGVINAALGKILSANYCVIDGVESLHVQLGDPDNPTSVFILPKGVTVTESLATNNIQGKILEYQSANVLIIGKVSQTFSQITEQLAQHLAFSS